MNADTVTITLEAKGKNALGTELMAWLRDELVAARGRPVILVGAGDAFSAGLNLKEVASLDDAGMRAFLELLEEVVERLFNHDAPTVAAVNGHAIAGGCVLARACDVAVATANPRARIGLNEVAIGLRFPPRTLRAMAWRIPRHHHAEVVLGAGLHAPEEALRLGLVDALAEDCVAEARLRMTRLAVHDAVAYAGAKAALQAGVTDVSEGEARAFLDEVVPLWTSAPIKAKIRAILGG